MDIHGVRGGGAWDGVGYTRWEGGVWEGVGFIQEMEGV
jgi:hypothetical protein